MIWLGHASCGPAKSEDNMQETWAHIWVVACKNQAGKFWGMEKVAGVSRSLSDPGVGPVYYLSAQDAFNALAGMEPEIAKSFGVFEIPIEKVFELSSPADEGISCEKESPKKI
jgi:hypothetical protein